MLAVKRGVPILHAREFIRGTNIADIAPCADDVASNARTGIDSLSLVWRIRRATLSPLRRPSDARASGETLLSRKPIELAPTYEHVEAGRDAYMQPTQLRKLAKESGRYWQFNGGATTVALSGNRFAKSLAGFTDHTEEESFREILREYSDFGVPRPGGYADVFHERYQSPRVQWSINSRLGPCIAGGWQEAISPGKHSGRYYKYDLCSAYLWAATLGLPSTSTYKRSLKPWKHDEGVFRVKLLGRNDGVPFPFNQAKECIATPFEIEMYGLKIGEVLDGVTWDSLESGHKVLDAIQEVSTWKQAARSYWGRWAQLQKITCHANGRSWQLPNRALNVPWAHTIISRVKMRLWKASQSAVHVFVDSVITTEKLPTGYALGDWRLEKTYDDGVFIRAPGQYGSISDVRLERMSGVGKDSPLRNNPVLFGGDRTKREMRKL